MDEQQIAAAWNEWSENYLDKVRLPLDKHDLEWAFKAGLSMGVAYGQTHERPNAAPMIGVHEMDIRSAYPHPFPIQKCHGEHGTDCPGYWDPAKDSIVTRDEKRSYD